MILGACWSSTFTLFVVLGTTIFVVDVFDDLVVPFFPAK